MGLTHGLGRIGSTSVSVLLREIFDIILIFADDDRIMPSSDTWETLRDKAAELPAETVLHTPLSRNRFLVTEVRDSSIRITYREGDQSKSLQRDKFETLLSRIVDAPNGFDYDRLPPNAEPYATVLSLHPRVQVDDRAGTITETDASTNSPLVDVGEERPEPTPRLNRGETSNEVSVDEMLSKMGSPKDTIECPITGCEYTNRSAESVAAHVSRSSTAKHIWANTSYAGWRDFVRKHE